MSGLSITSPAHYHDCDIPMAYINLALIVATTVDTGLTA